MSIAKNLCELCRRTDRFAIQTWEVCVYLQSQAYVRNRLYPLTHCHILILLSFHITDTFSYVTFSHFGCLKMWALTLFCDIYLLYNAFIKIYTQFVAFGKSHNYVTTKTASFRD